jgi:hypothetical protein
MCDQRLPKRMLEKKPHLATKNPLTPKPYASDDDNGNSCPFIFYINFFYMIGS